MKPENPERKPSLFDAEGDQESLVPPPSPPDQVERETPKIESSKIDRRFKHGHWKGYKPTRTYRIWNGMINRCKPEFRFRKYYFDKGIKVCERWRTFENFLTDVGEIPEPLTIDRIDSTRGYEPGNVRLVDMKGQGRNRSNNHLITIGGITKCLSEWAEGSGLPMNTLLNRINWGWPESDWLLPANATRNVFLTVRGRTQTITEWAKETGLSKDIICKRMKRGWPPERCLEPSGRPYRTRAERDDRSQ